MQTDIAIAMRLLSKRVNTLSQDQRSATGTIITVFQDLDDKVDTLINNTSNAVSLITPVSTAFQNRAVINPSPIETKTESPTTSDINHPTVPSQASITQGNGGSI